MKIAIQGHPTRGREIIQILESLGGKNTTELNGRAKAFYHIDKGEIRNDYYPPTDYKIYTLEEFEKEFPFKIGDKVILLDYSNKKGTIISIEPCGPIFSYFIKLENRNGIYRAAKYLKPYEEMKEERNVSLTLSKAREWYKKGGELREVALQAYSEEELNLLPRSWEEFCANYPVKNGECWLNGRNTIEKSTVSCERKYKNWIPSQKSAEAHLAMIQLEQLRNCWRNGWEPDWQNSDEAKYAIKICKNKSSIEIRYITHVFLSFPTREMAEEFLKCFRDLIEKAEDLI